MRRAQTGYRLSLAVTFILLAGSFNNSFGASDENVNTTPDSLRSATAFESISDETQRSTALFLEAYKVIESPRCMNCHPVDRSPTQGDDLHSHTPPILADAEGHGPPGLPCNSCHQETNVATQLATVQSIPGHGHWALAPPSMGWQGKSSGEICRQIKDRSLNGNRSLSDIHIHMAEDTLVGWAWQPGDGRKPAPGTQQQFGELILAWIDTGAVCP